MSKKLKLTETDKKTKEVLRKPLSEMNLLEHNIEWLHDYEHYWGKGLTNWKEERNKFELAEMKFKEEEETFRKAQFDYRNARAYRDNDYEDYGHAIADYLSVLYANIQELKQKGDCNKKT